MYKKIVSLSVACIISMFAAAQTTKPNAAPVSKPVYNFIILNTKLKYVFVENKPGAVQPKEGDDVLMHMIAICNNRFIYSSNQVNKGKPGAFNISKPAYSGDINEALMLMTTGDSIICLADAQSVFENAKTALPDYIKPGDKIQYNIRLVSIKSKEEVLKEQAAMLKAIQEAATKQNADTIKQKPLNNK